MAPGMIRPTQTGMAYCLSKDEWEAELRNKEQAGGRWNFEDADANNDGVVTREEAKAMKKRMRVASAHALYIFLCRRTR